MENRLKIDTHMHVVPPDYARWLSKKGLAAGGLPLPQSDADAALELMEASGTELAILSVSTPGVHLGCDDEARAMARYVNDYCSEVVQQHPGRFGFFATLTLPDVEGAIAEARYALEYLHADGVVVQASVRGTYLGDPSWEPLLGELNRRAATVFVHPGELPLAPLPGIPPFGADFLLDTTRAAMSYAKSGALERFPDVKVILAHAGGCVPYAAERMARHCSADGTMEGGIARLRSFYFDTALSSGPYALPSLLAFAQPDRVTFGSDWPYASRDRSLHFTHGLQAYPMSDAQRLRIYRENALNALPSIGRRLEHLARALEVSSALDACGSCCALRWGCAGPAYALCVPASLGAQFA